MLHKKNKSMDDKTGITDLKSLRKQTWFANEYNSYKVDEVTLGKIKALNNFNILVFGGGWCSDTQRELPRFIKILDQLDYPLKKLEIIFLDRNKECKNCELTNPPEAYKIGFVPTFILREISGKERGRIVETPAQSLEKDLSQLVN